MNTPTQMQGGAPEHSPLPWRASPTGQLYDANNRPLIGVGAFNSRWDAAFVRDEVNEPATLHAQLGEARELIARLQQREGELVGALEETLDAAQAAHSHLARISSPDTAWEHPLMRANRATLEAARALLQSVAKEGDSK